MKGQAALEMFLALTLALLMLLWVNNYAQSFADTTHTASTSTQLSIAFKAISSAYNTVCARGGKATIATPCLKYKGEDRYYAFLGNADDLFGGQGQLRIIEGKYGISYSARTACFYNGVPGSARLDLRCDETPFLCVEKYSSGSIANRVAITAGACT